MSTYFTGHPCSKGHIERRRTKTCACVGCERAKAPRYAAQKNITRAAWRSRKKSEGNALGVLWQETDPQKARAARVAWLQRNPQWVLPPASVKKQKERQSAYAAENRENISARQKRWYEDNKIRISAEAKTKYLENTEFYREKRRLHSKQNPIIRRAENQKRRARKKEALGSFTKSDVDALFKEQIGKCAACQCDIANAFHIDHKIALVRGGSNWPSNIQLLCPSCNLSKGALTMDEWRNKQGVG